MTSIEPYLQRIVGRFASPALQAALKGFTRTLQFRFTDTGENWLIRAVDGKEATLSQETVDRPDIVVTISTDDLAGILDKTVHPVATYLQGRFKVAGDMPDLMRLRKIIL